METQRTLTGKILTYSLIAVPALVFFALFFMYTIDIPVNDDYRAILSFLNAYTDASSFFEKLKLIFSQHNEHRIVYDKIWVLLNYKLTGTVNFNVLCLIGNLSLIGIFYVFYLRFKLLKVNLMYLVPLSILVFNIAFWENVTFAMSGMSNLTVFLFSLLCLYFLTTEKGVTSGNLALSIACMIAAVFTQGGGVFLVPVSLIVLLLQKKYRMALVYGLVSVLVLSMFFYGYAKPSYHPDVMEAILHYKIRALLFAFSFLGNAVNYFLIYTNDQPESIAVSGIVGFSFFLIFLNTIRTRYYQRNLFIFSIMLLIVIVSFVTGLNRCQLGLETSGASRYRINGVIFLIALYYWFIDTKAFKHKGLVVLVLSSLYFFLVSLSHYEYLSFRKRASILGALVYQSGDYSKLNGFEQEEYNKILTESRNKGIYHLPEASFFETFFPYSRINVPKEQTLSTSELRYSVDNVYKTSDSYLVDGWAFLENTPTRDQKVYIGLEADSSAMVLFSAKQEPRYDLNPYFHKFNLKDGGFAARIRFTDLKKGEHKIFVKVVNGNETKLLKTDKVLTN